MTRYLVFLTAALALASAAQAGQNTYLASQWWKGLSMQERLDGQLHQRKVARSVLATLEDHRLARLDPRGTRAARRDARARLRVLRLEMPKTREALKAERAAARAAAAVPVSTSTGYSGGYASGVLPDYVIACESGGDPNAVNPTTGAFGYAQVMPFHFQPGGVCYGLDPYNAADYDECVRRILASSGLGAWDCA